MLTTACVDMSRECTDESDSAVGPFFGHYLHQRRHPYLCWLWQAMVALEPYSLLRTESSAHMSDPAIVFDDDQLISSSSAKYRSASASRSASGIVAKIYAINILRLLACFFHPSIAPQHS